ncbi:hypothetical protein QBC47DRAFT_117181 [Echria macrotheca]|uniref:Uncharacterized protein n=1 Tax=Echria macrotheca TaxID=438768 RepID=A0AAJ0FFH4_9PEZI|nr:hypothetical protein QBC47DRAFT_117181 [Echria macrotheca]
MGRSSLRLGIKAGKEAGALFDVPFWFLIIPVLSASPLPGSEKRHKVWRLCFGPVQNWNRKVASLKANRKLTRLYPKCLSQAKKPKPFPFPHFLMSFSSRGISPIQIIPLLHPLNHPLPLLAFHLPFHIFPPRKKRKRKHPLYSPVYESQKSKTRNNPSHGENTNETTSKMKGKQNKKHGKSFLILHSPPMSTPFSFCPHCCGGPEEKKSNQNVRTFPNRLIGMKVTSVKGMNGNRNQNKRSSGTSTACYPPTLGRNDHLPPSWQVSGPSLTSISVDPHALLRRFAHINPILPQFRLWN